MATIHEQLAHSTGRLLIAADAVRAALFDVDQLRTAITDFWQALNEYSGASDDAAYKEVLAAARFNGDDSSIVKCLDYCLDLRDIIGLPSDLIGWRHSAVAYVRKVFTGNLYTWEPAPPERRQLLTELPECEGALLEPSLDDVAEAITRIRGSDGQEWRYKERLDPAVWCPQMLKEAATIDAQLRLISTANRTGETAPLANTETATITKKLLARALRISSSELRNRLKSGEIRLAEVPSRSAKTVKVCLDCLSDADRTSVMSILDNQSS
jgi:hypothetical protein